MSEALVEASDGFFVVERVAQSESPVEPFLSRRGCGRDGEMARAEIKVGFRHGDRIGNSFHGRRYDSRRRSDL